MAEGLLRAIGGDRFEASSAGIERHGLNPMAVEVMQEIGIDISAHESKTLDELDDPNFDCVIAVCGHANKTCPAFPGDVKKIFAGFDDPPKLAANAASRVEAISHYRRVRDEIAAFVSELPERV